MFGAETAGLFQAGPQGGARFLICTHFRVAVPSLLSRPATAPERA